uniref:Uncharacterized protein n=1 Tax=Rhizophora mucronata TaxID=61149 RepID=A0A2P2P9I3_RHIMU
MPGVYIEPRILFFYPSSFLCTKYYFYSTLKLSFVSLSLPLQFSLQASAFCVFVSEPRFSFHRFPFLSFEAKPFPFVVSLSHIYTRSCIQTIDLDAIRPRS